MRTIREEWQSYALGVIPSGAPKVQFQECKRAFYAGARSLLQLMRQAGEMTDREAVTMLGRLEQELTAFRRDVEAGRA